MRYSIPYFEITEGSVEAYRVKREDN